ncbi:MAG TPA: hypothetical protein DIC30_03000 [Oceanospirillales bacterium]|nr:hypothetical protein [Oceanospirillales bacterium]
MLDDTQANVGYWHHLPSNYEIDEDQQFPLLVYLHGEDANAEKTGEDQAAGLDAVANNGGPITMIRDNQWDSELPFIVVSPHIGLVSPRNDHVRFDAFIEYLKHTYKIDEKRIYIAGWGYGGSIAYHYTVKFPNKIAALITVSSAYPWGDTVPNDLCDAEKIPMWFFHGNEDMEVEHKKSIASKTKITENCQPTTEPKLSIVLSVGHNLHHSIFDLTGMVGGEQEYQFDDRYDSYDQDIYSWLLNQEKIVE